MTNRYIANRGLPERSKLQFFFPNSLEGEDYFVVALPFFENPQISERKKAKYNTYDLISRSSNLYTYLGATSRTFTVQFNMTLDHILDHGNITIEKYVPILRGEFNQESERNRFFKSNFAETDGTIGADSPAARLANQFAALQSVKDSARQVLLSDFMQNGALTNQAAIDYVKTTYKIENDPGIADLAINVGGRDINDEKLIEKTVNPSAELNLEDDPNPEQIATHNLLKAIDVIIYWVNIVRSSVINNAQNPLFGPPIIRLTHGIMYQDVPCICKNYSLSFNEAMGYDLKTLLPRQIRITMNLEEVRTGDFGEFDPTSQNTRIRDNLAGWEAVIEKSTMSLDPGSGGRTA